MASLVNADEVIANVTEMSLQDSSSHFSSNELQVDHGPHNYGLPDHRLPQVEMYSLHTTTELHNTDVVAAIFVIFGAATVTDMPMTKPRLKYQQLSLANPPAARCAACQGATVTDMQMINP